MSGIQFIDNIADLQHLAEGAEVSVSGTVRDIAPRGMDPRGPGIAAWLYGHGARVEIWVYVEVYAPNSGGFFEGAEMTVSGFIKRDLGFTIVQVTEVSQ